MALTVEELQIVLSCDATTAQKVLDQMNATVKAYTEKFQRYFNQLGMDKSPKGIVGDVKAVEKQLNNVTKAIESKGNDWKKAYEKTWGESFSKSMSKAFKYDFSSNPNAKWYTPEWLQKQRNSQPNFRYVGPEMGQGGGGFFQKIKDEAVGLGRAIHENIGPSLSRGFSAIGSGISSAVESARPKVQAFFQELATIAQVSGSKIGAVLRGAITLGVKGGIGAIKLVGRTLGGIVGAARSVGGAIKKAFSHTLLGKFVKRLGSVLLRMAAMRLIRGTIDGFRKGLEELAKTSTSSAKAMNQMKAAGGSIKMALGAMLMPIVKALVPWFYKLAQVVTAAANVIAQFFARVTGQDHYTAVTLSDGLDDVSESAGGAHKKMKSVLADFDELVVISKSSGGGGGGSTGVESSFSTVADQLAFSHFADLIREKLAAGNWEGVGREIALHLNEGIAHWNPTETAQKLSTFIENALDTAIGFLENFDFRELGEKVATFFEEIDWNGIADRLFEGLGAAIGGLGAFLAGLFGDAWQSVKDWFTSYSFDEDGNFVFEGFLNGISDAVANISGWIQLHIFQPFIDGFKKAFGIASPAEEMKGPGEYVGQGILEGIEAPFKAIGTWVNDHIVQPIKDWFANHKPSLDLDFDFPDILPDLSGITDAWNSLVGGKKSLNLEAKTSGNDSKGTVIEKIKKAWDGLTGKTNSDGEGNITLTVTNDIDPNLNQDVKDLTSSWGGLAKDGKKSVSLNAKQTGDKPSVFQTIAESWIGIGVGGEKKINVDGNVKEGLTDKIKGISTAWNGISTEKKTLTTTHGGDGVSVFQSIKDVWDSIPAGNRSASLTTTLSNSIGLGSGSIADKLSTLWSKIFSKDATLTTNLNDKNSAVSKVLGWWNSLDDNKNVTFEAKMKSTLVTAWNAAVRALNNLTGLNIPQLASGGLAYGPTMALMGEYAGARSNPEVIAPLSKLSSILESTGSGGNSKAVEEQNELLREQNRLLRQIAQKDWKVTPSVQLGQVVERSRQLYART